MICHKSTWICGYSWPYFLTNFPQYKPRLSA